MLQIPFSRHRLANGLRIVLSPDPGTPLVAIDLYYLVGSKHETPGRTGFAHLFEHLMFQGSEHVAKGEHASLVGSAGGTFNASTAMDVTNYYETLPVHELELGLWLEADRLGGLMAAMSQAKLDNQRDVVKNERRAGIDNQPYGDWDERVQAYLFPPGHGYHHPVIGSMADLDAAGLDDVEAFFRAYYGPDNCVLTIAGGFEEATALAMVERHFGHIPARSVVPAQPDMRIAPTLGAGLRADAVGSVPLPRVILAHRVPVLGDPSHDALTVVGRLLAAGRSSRLQRRLVRGSQLAQGVSYNQFALLSGSSVMTLVATARPGVDVVDLEAALLAEIDELSARGPSEVELARVGNLHAAGFAASLQRTAGRADWLSQGAAYFDDPGRLNNHIARFRAVDAQRVRSAMSSYLRPDNRFTLRYLRGSTRVNRQEA